MVDSRETATNGRRRWLRRVGLVVLAVVVLPLLGGLTSVFGGSSDWRTAPRHSIGIAPDPATSPEAIVQVYAARAFSWRGALGVHTWIAVKPTNAPAFTVYEAIGWNLYYGRSVVTRSNRPADGMWFGNPPTIIAELRGDGVDDVIARIDAASNAYPYADSYAVWPGPNSNTYIAYIAREVPELKVDLPPTAIGKDYLTNGSIFAETPSGTGYQVSLWGLFGIMVAADEGLEVNLLGLTFGVDVTNPALKLPGIGRLGFGTTIGG